MSLLYSVFSIQGFPVRCGARAVCSFALKTASSSKRNARVCQSGSQFETCSVLNFCHLCIEGALAFTVPFFSFGSTNEVRWSGPRKPGSAIWYFVIGADMRCVLCTAAVFYLCGRTCVQYGMEQSHFILTVDEDADGGVLCGCGSLETHLRSRRYPACTSRAPRDQRLRHAQS